MIYGHPRALPMAKPEERVTPPETIERQVEAAERAQDKFDADPSLKDLYPGFSSLLKVIAANVKTPEKESENKA